MSLGGGGSTTSNTVSKFEPPSWAANLYPDLTNVATQMAAQPAEQYYGMKVAPWNDYQDTAALMTQDRAVYGAPDLNAGRAAATGIASGGFFNPYSSNQYTDQMIANTAGNMAQGFAQGTAAQNDAAANMQGAYGGGSWALKQSNDAAGLAKQIADMATQTRMSQSNLGAQTWNQDVGNMLQAGALGGQLSQDDWTAMNALGAQGDKMNKYTQALLGEDYNTWAQQQAQPFQNYDWLLNKIGQTAGQSGGQSTQYTQPGQSPLASLAGLGLLGYGLMG